MTKRRDPATFADAVTRVAGLLTWGGAADAVGRSERTVRNWSEPDTGALPTIEDALRLDAAFMAAGGGEPPVLAVYRLRLDVANRERADAQAIAEATSLAAKEGGEALAALVAAARPEASDQDRKNAQREALEAVDAFTEAARRLSGGQE